MNSSLAYHTLISPEALQALRQQNAGRANAVVVFDCRADLADHQAGRRAYEAGHLPGAHFLSLEDVLSGAKNGRNGRHPLPAREALAATLAACGVDDESTQIVAYDSHGGTYAARLWWLVRWLGHARVAVLDGGLPAWQAAGLPLDTREAPAVPGRFAPAAALQATVDARTLLADQASRRLTVVDARSPDRYRGENETIDPVGGHIPGALNRFFKDNLASDGRFKSKAELREAWQALLDGRAMQDVVLQCGSGVTACHNALALAVAGLDGARLYPGSWSEWCSDPARPVARGAAAG